jgi:hypothetical protein
VKFISIWTANILKISLVENTKNIVINNKTNVLKSKIIVFIV